MLCGGRSRRMGRDKAWLPFDGLRLLQRAVRNVAACVDEVVVVARPGQDLPELPADVIVVRDDVPDRGPIGGLVPGLRASRDGAAVFATSCDAPFVQPSVVGELLDRIEGADVAVARSGGFTHPLCAVYRTGVRPTLERLLADGRLRPVYLFDEVATTYVDEPALRRLDPDLATLRNLNPEEEYERALRDTLPSVRFELFDLARARAGLATTTVHATTLGAALLALADRCPGLVPDVLSADGRLAPHWRVSAAGAKFLADPDISIEGTSPLLLLSALAGG